MVARTAAGLSSQATTTFRPVCSNRPAPGTTSVGRGLWASTCSTKCTPLRQPGLAAGGGLTTTRSWQAAWCISSGSAAPSAASASTETTPSARAASWKRRASRPACDQASSRAWSATSMACAADAVPSISGRPVGAMPVRWA